MAIERTFVLLKPDALAKGLEVVGQIHQRYREAGLTILHMEEIHLTSGLAQALYVEHSEEPYFQGLYLAMSGHICQLLVIEGTSAIGVVRALNGPVKGPISGTIRCDFPSAGGPYNMVHAPDSKAAFDREFPIVAPVWLRRFMEKSDLVRPSPYRMI